MTFKLHLKTALETLLKNLQKDFPETDTQKYLSDFLRCKQFYYLLSEQIKTEHNLDSLNSEIHNLQQSNSILQKFLGVTPAIFGMNPKTVTFRLQVLSDTADLYGKKLADYCDKVSDKYPGRKLNHNTVRKWRADFENKGISGLIPAWGKNRLKLSKYNKIYTGLFYEFYYVQKKGSARICAELVKKTLGEESCKNFPHHSTLRRHTRIAYKIGQNFSRVTRHKGLRR